MKNIKKYFKRRRLEKKLKREYKRKLDTFINTLLWASSKNDDFLYTPLFKKEYNSQKHVLECYKRAILKIIKLKDKS